MADSYEYGFTPTVPAGIYTETVATIFVIGGTYHCAFHCCVYGILVGCKVYSTMKIPLAV
jgi:hypothetical protein